MILDYELLRFAWWILLGVLLAGFAIMDGFDLGAAMLLPVITKKDMDRRILLNSIGPTWEGNQVWFILGGGAIFAAWPSLYALSFSGFYLAMLLILLALILRPVGFKYRSKLENPIWRSVWDYALFIGGFVPSLVFGVAMGNVLQGVPFHFDESLRPFYTGTFLELLNPFALLCGIISVLMLSMQGAWFLNIKTKGDLQSRAIIAGRICGMLMSALLVIAGLWLHFGMKGYSLVTALLHDGPSNPLGKEVIMEAGAWMNNFNALPWLWAVPVLAVLMPLMAMLLYKRTLIAFICSSIATGMTVATVGVSMFPFILPSSTAPGSSLMVWDSSSSQLTLMIMLVAVLIFMPLILAYTTWVYRVLWGKVSEESIKSAFTAY